MRTAAAVCGAPQSKGHQHPCGNDGTCGADAVTRKSSKPMQAAAEGGKNRTLVLDRDEEFANSP